MKHQVVAIVNALTGFKVELNKSSYTATQDRLDEHLADLGFVKVDGICSKTERAIVVSNHNGLICVNYNEVTMTETGLLYNGSPLVSPEIYIFTGEVTKQDVAHEVYVVLKGFVNLPS